MVHKVWPQNKRGCFFHDLEKQDRVGNTKYPSAAHNHSIWSISLLIQSNHSIGWPWPWPIWCTSGSYRQYVLQFGSKMPIWHLAWGTLDDLDLDLFCAPGCHIINICWNMVKKNQFDLWPWPWPWVILCTMVSYNQHMLKYDKKNVNLTFDLDWPWMTLTFDLDLGCWRSFTQT